MISPFKKPLNQRSPFRRDLRPAVESLEGRLAMSTTPTIAALGLPVVGTISGQVTNSGNGLSLRHVEVNLINAAGRVVKSTTTNAEGKYAFNITNNGAYVVHVDAPSGFVQTTPTFSNGKPTGTHYIPAPPAARGRIRAPTRTRERPG